MIDPMMGPVELRQTLERECFWLTPESRVAIEDAAAHLRMREWDYSAETEGGYSPHSSGANRAWQDLVEARQRWAQTEANYSL